MPAWAVCMNCGYEFFVLSRDESTLLWRLWMELFFSKRHPRTGRKLVLHSPENWECPVCGSDDFGDAQSGPGRQARLKKNEDAAKHRVLGPSLDRPLEDQGKAPDQAGDDC
jgi:rubredoxin